MLKSHEKFHSANGKRLILVADDEAVNREILGMILENDYEVIFASDGQETLDQVNARRSDLSLVLLDLMMPVKTGMEALREMKADPELRLIPVIVLTADQNAEIESLNIGAIDYISKPYPQAAIILARVLRAIELSEDREIIQYTERDPLTDLYNKEFFYRYAEQYDQHHKDADMDAAVVDINHFNMINERFGTAYGDEVLRRVGEKLRDAVKDDEGIVCRREADTFMIYCPHREDYKEIVENASVGLAGDESSVNKRVRLRLGLYAHVDKSLEIGRRFDRAKMAADTVRNSFTQVIGIYDSTMRERELYREQLIDDFHKALEEKQFKIYFQPKFDVRPKAPALSSAEALVRWQHPTLGLISPGVFIPLFEDNGLIRELDHYVWRETAAQISAWKKSPGFSVPVSVNVSRIDMYDPDLIGKFSRILQDNGLGCGDLLLEITESAYTKDSEQIIETVNRLRESGFRIEMDDFGTGYSSLNMISTLPIDALKLDMHFVRSAFKEQRDTRMLEVIIGIADRLDVPVIAEGVETEEQLIALRDLGCDIVQGYYFSKPVPAEEFLPFLEARMRLEPADLEPEIIQTAEEPPEQPAENTAEEAPPPKEKQAVRLKAVSFVFVILIFILAGAMILADLTVSRCHDDLDKANLLHDRAVEAALQMEAGSDFLTVSVRTYVVTGDTDALNDYFTEVNVTKRRDSALEKLDDLLKGSNPEAYAAMSEALNVSNELMGLEYRAMRLTQLSLGQPDGAMPPEITAVSLGTAESGGTPEEQRALAIGLVFGDTYRLDKDLIRNSIDRCTADLIASTAREMAAIRTRLDRMMLLQGCLLALLALAVVAEVVFVNTQIRMPLARLVERIREQEPAALQGAAEMRFVIKTYNEMLHENKKANKRLSYEASHDPLTGLLNRSGYDMFMETADQEHIALIVIDVDNFKSINDTYGHDGGDRVLKRVAEILLGSFRSVDAICRMGGDEFVVVMTRANSTMRQLVKNKIAHTNSLLQHPEGDVPKASLSVGVAFADRKNPKGSLFKDADTALYQVKESGRCGCAVYGEKPGEEDE